MNLQELRTRIDQLDDSIINLLIERMVLAKRTKSFKQDVEDLRREEEIIARLQQKEIEKEFVEELYCVIFKYSKKHQDKLREE